MMVKHLAVDEKKHQRLYNYEDQLEIPTENWITTKALRWKIRMFRDGWFKCTSRERELKIWVEQNIHELPEDISLEQAIEFLTEIPEEPSLLPYLEFYSEEYSEYFIMCCLC